MWQNSDFCTSEICDESKLGYYNSNNAEFGSLYTRRCARAQHSASRIVSKINLPHNYGDCWNMDRAKRKKRNIFAQLACITLHSVRILQLTELHLGFFKNVQFGILHFREFHQGFFKNTHCRIRTLIPVSKGLI